VLNAAEFASLAAAIAALPAQGGTIQLPAQTDASGNVRPYVVESTLTITKPVTFVGEGRGATVIRPGGTNPAYHLFDVRSGSVQFEQLTIDGRASRATGYDCVQLNGIGIGGRIIPHCVLRDVQITHAGRNALRAVDTIMFEADNSAFIFSQGDGVHIDAAGVPGLSATTTMRFMNSSFSQNAGRGVYLPGNGAGITFFGCVFEGNDGGGGPNDGAGLTARDIFRLELYSCYFEDPPEGGAAQFLYLESCHSAIVDGCIFYASPKGARLARTANVVGSSGARFSNNVAQGCTTEAVRFDSECPGAIEFGNRDLDVPIGGSPRIAILGRGVTSLSSGALGVGRYFTGNRPVPGLAAGSALPGSILWREDADAAAGEGRLQVSDGRAWRNIPVVASTSRTVFVPADAMRRRSGAPGVAESGTFPDRYAYAEWPASGTNGLGVEWLVPPDYAVGSPVTLSVVWTPAAGGSGAWVGEATFLARGNGESLAGEGVSLRRTIGLDRAAPDDARFAELGTTGKTAITRGELLRLSLARRSMDAADTHAGAIRVLGLVIEYPVGP
jgi:hypothetical protein